MNARVSRHRRHVPVPVTAESLTAMSEDDYMNAAQLAFFRERLEHMREGLAHARTVVVPEADADAPAEAGDRALLEEERSLAASLRQHQVAQLAAIDAALERIADGTYGYCTQSGDPIGLARLLAYPTAAYSIEVQERRELQQRRGEVAGPGSDAVP